ncbi:hypothetical protein Hanom_Chr15g01346511 [Helianthus anomalus]
MYNDMRSQSIHSPWNIRQVDVMTDPSLCRELEGCFPTCGGNVILRNWHALSQKEEEYHRFKSEAAATMDNLKAAQERLAKEKVDFEEYKRTEEWSAVATNEQVRCLTKILSQERKLWYEACARDNDEFYHILQEIINLKAANAGLAKNDTAVSADGCKTRFLSPSTLRVVATR